MRPTVAGERANDCEDHDPSSSLVGDPTAVRRKRLNSPWEICGMSRNRDWRSSDSSWPCRRSQHRAK